LLDFAQLPAGDDVRFRRRRPIGRTGFPETEERDPFVHGVGLILERLGGRGVLLDQR
jgi:hypothetical protein